MGEHFHQMRGFFISSALSPGKGPQLEQATAGDDSHSRLACTTTAWLRCRLTAGACAFLLHAVDHEGPSDW